MGKIKVITICLFISIMLIGPKAFSQTAEDLYQKGVQLEEIKGELEKAIEVYSSVIKEYPSIKELDAMAQLHIGLCYEKLGKNKLTEAVSSFQKVIKFYPNQTEAVQIAKKKLEIDTDESAIQEIKYSIAEWNKAYESKDINKYDSFLSKQFIEGCGGISKAKENIVNNYFSKWKQISVVSTIKSIDKIGYNYIADEEVSFINTNWSNELHSELGVHRFLTFIKEDGRWKILNLRNQIPPPAIYKGLSDKYPGIGSPGLCYANHITHDFVSVIDTKTDSLIGKISSGSGSCDIALSPNSENGYIANYNSNDITVFNKITNENLKTVPVGEHPSNLLITPDGQFVLITHESPDALWVMSTKDNQIINKNHNITGHLLNDTANNKIYSSAIFTPYVFVLNPINQAIIKQIEVGGRPMDLAITPDGKFIYVPNYDLSEVEKIDTHLDSVVNRIHNINNGRGIAISPDGNYAYVTNVIYNTVTVIDLKNDTVFKTIFVGRMPTSARANVINNCIYVSNQGEASISIIDIKSNAVVKTIPVADNPIYLRIF
ncbi:MAG: tetratricopeptide repeat protein [Ignavibacteriaceae bacterium]